MSPWCIFIDPANDRGSVGRMLVSHSPFGSTQRSLTLLPTHWDRLWQDFTSGQTLQFLRVGMSVTENEVYCQIATCFLHLPVFRKMIPQIL